MKDNYSLDTLLQSVSDVLFPEHVGEKKVQINSRSSNGDTPLHVVIWRNNARAVETLIAAGADVDAVGEMGETPLHVAVSKKNLSIVQSLLNAGADPNIGSEFGDTPKERALKRNDDIALLFL